VLDGVEKSLVFQHASRLFRDLVPAGSSCFDDLPFLDKEHAAPWYGQLPEGAREFSTTGTSGQPKSVPWTPDEDNWYVQEKQDLFEPWLRGCSRAFVSLGAGHNAGSAAAVLRGLGLTVYDAGLSPLDDQCAAIAASAPEVLYCSPSILANLMAGLRRRGKRPASVQRVITNGEVLLPSARADAQVFFGLAAADLMDTYGTTEVGTIAHTCPVCATYHLLDGLYPEPAPAVPAEAVAGRPADPIVLSLSSVKRTSFPVIRFVTYDLVRGLRRSRCGGVARFSFDRIVGRTDDIITYGELLSPYGLADLISRWLPTARWFVFNPHNDLTIVVEGDEPAGFRDELWRRYPLHGRMVGLGLLDPPVIRFVRDFDRFVERTGLPQAGRGKAALQVLRVAPQLSWLDETGDGAGR
jgi:phenylacetate-coenzyme A ligase PaaK-like adenylate-forming protein